MKKLPRREKKKKSSLMIYKRYERFFNSGSNFLDSTMTNYKYEFIKGDYAFDKYVPIIFSRYMDDDIFIKWVFI
jgi:hypothetical protein